MNIRNFCIIAHIDHGKSTLADRFLELTQTVQERKMKNQLLDQMDLEREKGITIKLQPVKMEYKSENKKDYILNLIDTPGHIDFTYEVSRSLAAVEGAVLLVDATQGIQAQTLANLYLALDQDLEIIPVINKIDMISAEVEKVKGEIVHLLGCKEDDILLCSAKTGQGVEEILERIIKVVPEPKITESSGFKALIFDSVFNDYKGVISYVRVFEGKIKKGDKIKYMYSDTVDEILEVGYFTPNLVVGNQLVAGEIGYIISGAKNLEICRVGDTIASLDCKEMLPGYKEVVPFVFAGLFCKQGDDYAKLRQALNKLKLNDAALVFEPEHSPALGFGFRCGFLGMLHLEIISERIKREYDLDLIITAPSVAYKIILSNLDSVTVTSPIEFPDPNNIKSVNEPCMKVDIVCNKEYIGAVMSLVQEKRGEYITTDYIDDTRVVLHYTMPLFSLIVDFYDKLKSVSSGYASLSYEFDEYKETKAVKLDVIVADKVIDSLTSIVYKDEAPYIGRKVVDSLKEVLPRQMFEVKIQASIGSKIVASTRLPALRKDVTAKLYGGDVTRKRKLLEKQKKGKKKMKLMGMGKVDIPAEAFISVLKR